MKTKSCKWLSLLLAVAMLAGLFACAPFTATAAGSDPYHGMGYCGADADQKNVEWYLFEDGSIAFFGSGAMKNFDTPAAMSPSSPWYINRTMEALMGNKIAIEDGITTVGDYAFYLPPVYTFYLQTYNIDLPNSLTTIGAHAFENQNKLQKIAIPKNVTSIGEGAFNGCSAVTNIDLYCDPSGLEWVPSRFTKTVTCHILPDYQSQLSALQTRFADKNIVFEANLHVDRGLVDDNVDRNIKAYFGTENDKIFGGAAPIVIVGTFSGAKKSVTHGNNGFVSCVKVGSEYYVHTSNQSGSIQKANVNGTTGIVESLGAQHTSLYLTVTRDYIGTNIVRLKYHLENRGSSAVNDVMLGGTGDIKIGADDLATIEPLNETVGGEEKQVGFYMKSGQDYDKGDDNKYATLGFIGKNVDITEEQKSDDATFFYGKAAANITESATGAYRLRLMPQRVFEKNNPVSQESDSFSGADSGMSYYWNIGTLESNDYKDYAVLFSVYGTSTEEGGSKGTEMVTDKGATYHTVTWRNADTDRTVLVQQVVKDGETPVYPLETPVKAEDNSHYYTFKNWTTDGTTEAAIGPCNEDTTYIASYDKHQKAFFKGHSLTLGGDIGVNFFIDPTVADSTKYGSITKENINDGTHKVVVRFSWYDKNSEHIIQTGDVDYDSETNCFIATCNVAAAEMAYDIHAIAYIDGKRYEEEENHYSVRQYGNEIIYPTTDEIKNMQTNDNARYLKLRRLACTMLDYGAKSQEFFDRKKNVNGTSIPFANADVKAEDYTMESHTIEGEFPDMNTGLDAYGLKYYGTTVVFLSKTSLRQYYQVIDRSKFESTLSEEERACFVPNGNLYYLEVSDIKSSELDKKQPFTIGSVSHSCSALDYGIKLQSSSSQAAQDLGTALYWYNQAAKNYFPQISD